MPVKSGELLKKEQYLHFRVMESKGVSARGGATVCYLPQGDKAYLSLALCAPSDIYCKKVGRIKAKVHAGRYPGNLGPLLTFDQLMDKAKAMVLAQNDEQIHRKLTRLEGLYTRAQAKILSRKVLGVIKKK